ncbi:unnamed protein product [Rhizopus stolonifer]
MSAYNNDIHPHRDDRLGSGQLNENHGIAATGLNDSFAPHHANRTSQNHDLSGPNEHNIPGSTQHNVSGHNEHSTHGLQEQNFSGPVIGDERKVDQDSHGLHEGGQSQNRAFDQNSNAPGMHNPSSNNRTAATGIPPVNTTHAAEQNSGVDDLSSRAHEGVNRSHSGSASRGDHGASHHQQYQNRSFEGKAPSGSGVEQQMAHHSEHPTTVDEVGHKPSAGEKLKGNFEKMTGKVTGNQTKVVKGDNLVHGRSA